jgi:hypothetical protein
MTLFQKPGRGDRDYSNQYLVIVTVGMLLVLIEIILFIWIFS